jgi:predicted esterase
MIRILFALLLLVSAWVPARANSDARHWTLDGKDTFYAALVSYDEKAGTAVLRIGEREDRTYDVSRLSISDRAWLAEWLDFAEAVEGRAKLLGGRFVHLATTGRQPTDLYVYYPTSARDDTPPLPALILFQPTGKASSYVKRHMEAAEKTGLVLIGCGSFRNTLDEAEDELFRQRFKEILPQILARVRLDPARVFLGGTSGGAMRAFQYSALFPRPWAGIYSNGGWLGGPDYYHLPYASGMRVAMVNGSSDLATIQWVDRDSEVLIRAGSTVGVISFEGGHQVPPVRTQINAFNWLLGRPDAENDSPPR